MAILIPFNLKLRGKLDFKISIYLSLASSNLLTLPRILGLDKFFVIFASIILLLSVWLVMAKTKFGLLLRATQLDSETAQAFGIPISTVYSLVFGAGAAIAAVGAVLIVPIQQAHYLMGGEPLLLAFIVVIIGGLGSLRGTVAAAVLIGMSDGIISVYCNPEYEVRLDKALTLSGKERHEALKVLVKETHDLYAIGTVGLLQRAYAVPEGFKWEFGLDHRMVAVNMSQ